jgi:hypothetical protein
MDRPTIPASRNRLRGTPTAKAFSPQSGKRSPFSNAFLALMRFNQEGENNKVPAGLKEEPVKKVQEAG